MSGSLNKVTLIGNLGKDPEIRSFQNGGRAAHFSLATTDSWKDKESGERKERTEWHQVLEKFLG
jgi:single-strand DNA-binding protein